MTKYHLLTTRLKTQCEDGHAITRAVSYWPFTVLTQVQFQVSFCGVYGRRSATGQLFIDYFSSSANSHSAKCSISLIQHPRLVKWAIYSLSTKGPSFALPKQKK